MFGYLHHFAKARPISGRPHHQGGHNRGLSYTSGDFQDAIEYDLPHIDPTVWVSWQPLYRELQLEWHRLHWQSTAVTSFWSQTGPSKTENHWMLLTIGYSDTFANTPSTSVTETEVLCIRLAYKQLTFGKIWWRHQWRHPVPVSRGNMTKWTSQGNILIQLPETSSVLFCGVTHISTALPAVLRVLPTFCIKLCIHSGLNWNFSYKIE